MRNIPVKPPIRSININNSSQPMVVRHLISSSRGIPVTMSVVPPYTPDVSLNIKILFVLYIQDFMLL